MRTTFPIPPTPVPGAAERKMIISKIPVANGQELLGPCSDCHGYWTRELVRGQKPLTCPVCKRGEA